MARKKAESRPSEGTPESQPSAEPPREEMVREIEEMVHAISGLATAADPLARSLTPEQIDRLFELIEKERERQSRERFQSRGYLVALVVFALLVICFLWITALSYSRPELASDLLKVVSGILMGLLGGYSISGVAGRTRRTK